MGSMRALQSELVALWSTDKVCNEGFQTPRLPSFQMSLSKAIESGQTNKRRRQQSRSLISQDAFGPGKITPPAKPVVSTCCSGNFAEVFPKT